VSAGDRGVSRWPGGARCAVLVSVDLDAELPILVADPANAAREKTLSVGRYGARRGTDRLLAMLADAGVRATWFVPGQVAELHPGAVAEVHAAGHELANHGHRHEDFDLLTVDGQADAVRRGSAALTELTGRSPTGFRTPLGSWKPRFAGRLAGLGITWSSSGFGDDLPYLHPGGDSAAALVEIPVHHELHDHPYFFFNLQPPFPAGQSRIAPYRHVLGNWLREFTAYHRFGLCYVLRLQPEVIGTPGRIGLLRELLAHIGGHDDVWLGTGGEIADWWRARGVPNDPGHPADLFAKLTAAAPDPPAARRTELPAGSE
jgi:peptidoglycan/xylan/chitin deacetylase (PgdA/CDA1 family)